MVFFLSFIIIFIENFIEILLFISQYFVIYCRIGNLLVNLKLTPPTDGGTPKNFGSDFRFLALFRSENRRLVRAVFLQSFSKNRRKKRASRPLKRRFSRFHPLTVLFFSIFLNNFGFLGPKMSIRK